MLSAGHGAEGRRRTVLACLLQQRQQQHTLPASLLSQHRRASRMRRLLPGWGSSCASDWAAPPRIAIAAVLKAA
jgi:hypothetical protein